MLNAEIQFTALNSFYQANARLFVWKPRLLSKTLNSVFGTIFAKQWALIEFVCFWPGIPEFDEILILSRIHWILSQFDLESIQLKVHFILTLSTIDMIK